MARPKAHRLSDLIRRVELRDPVLADQIAEEVRQIFHESMRYRTQLRREQGSSADQEEELSKVGYVHHWDLVAIATAVETAGVPGPACAEDLRRSIWAFLTTYGIRTAEGVVTQQPTQLALEAQ